MRIAYSLLLLALVWAVHGAYEYDELYISTVRGVGTCAPIALRILDGYLYSYLPTTFNNSIYVDDIVPYSGSSVALTPGVSVTGDLDVGSLTSSSNIQPSGTVKTDGIDSYSGSVISIPHILAVSGNISPTSVSLSGDLTVDGALGFSGSSSTLNLFQIKNMTLTATGPMASPVSVTIKAMKLGTFVILTIPRFTSTAGGTAGPIILSTVDADYRPAGAFYKLGICSTGASSNSCMGSIDSSGVITVGLGSTTPGANFSGTSDTGIYSMTLSYHIS